MPLPKAQTHAHSNPRPKATGSPQGSRVPGPKPKRETVDIDGFMFETDDAEIIVRSIANYNRASPFQKGAK